MELIPEIYYNKMMQTKQTQKHPYITIHRHDSYQLEIKVKYPSPPLSKKTSYFPFMSFFAEEQAIYNTEIYF